MADRLELHEKLVKILGSRNVYYQPPESTKMVYPCIKYDKGNLRNNFANNGVYKQSQFYEITVIDHVKDSEIAKKVSRLPTASYSRRYTVDGLYHEVYTIYY